MKTLRLIAPVALKARAGKGPRKLQILGYSGGIMIVSGWGPLVIDLAGLELPATTPVLQDHRNEIAGIVGTGRPATDGKTISVSAVFADTAAGRQVVRLLADGHDLSASIGCEPIAIREVDAGKAISVNGRTIEADHPFTLVTKSQLREMTITPIGADPNTSVSLAAKAAGVSPMSFEEWLTSIGLDPAGLSEEQRARLMEEHAKLYPDAYAEMDDDEDEEQPEATNASVIIEILGEFAGTLWPRARRERWSVRRAQRESLKMLRAARNQSSDGSPIALPWNLEQRSSYHAAGGRGSQFAHIEAAFLVRAGFEKAAEKAYGERVMEASRPLHRAAFPDLLGVAMRAAGMDLPIVRNDMIRAALSGGVVTNILSNVSNKLLEMTWREAPATWRSFCAVRTADDFKEHTSIRPTFPGNLEILPEGGGLKHGTLGESAFTWQVHQFGKIYWIDRKDVINDDLSAFSEVTPSLAKAAIRLLADLVYSTRSWHRIVLRRLLAHNRRKCQRRTYNTVLGPHFGDFSSLADYNLS